MYEKCYNIEKCLHTQTAIYWAEPVLDDRGNKILRRGTVKTVL